MPVRLFQAKRCRVGEITSDGRYVEWRNRARQIFWQARASVALLLGAVLLALSGNGSMAQVYPGASGAAINEPPTAVIQAIQKVPPKTSYEVQLTWMTVAIGVATICIFCLMHWRGRRLPKDFYRHFTLCLVVFASLFVIVAGYTESQIAPVFGLLGSIVGYIFGRSGNADEGAMGPQQGADAPRQERQDQIAQKGVQNE
jgi:hypothetical protein